MVASLAHPGGNLTGLSFDNDYLSGKRLDLLREMVPNLKEVAAFYFGGSASKSMALAATERPRKSLVSNFMSGRYPPSKSFEPAFASAAAAHVDAVDVLGHPFFNANRERFAELAAKYRLPAIYESGEYVRSGCLMGYGPVFAEMGGAAPPSSTRSCTARTPATCRSRSRPSSR